ncbi:hypothetical protein CPB83DRAFT_778940 [Crepidotus variabilis]|uniref:S-adenosyl-L-methionine-dependent methyltransferase n=1 Tax=Crepidotus variabilis TaxID=179855 RepID=A0A9P6BC62_9AGAR|nr:hypothetical protein CPB83DRAFT_778940 [Crepidotus variabilis]
MNCIGTDLQHQILLKILGEKYASCMVEILEEDETSVERKSCLDLGCGTGMWIIDVARDFPHIEAVAVDLIPLREIELPQNLRSEVDDINLGLEHYFSGFDVVHARLIAAGISDYHHMIDQLAHVVRPGGLIDLSEFDFYIYDINHQKVLFDGDGDIRAPWWARWMYFFRNAVKEKGGDVDAATNLHTWVCSNSLFENVAYKEHWLPIVPGLHTSQTGNIEENMKSNVLTFLGAGRLSLLGNGMPEVLVTRLEREALRELEENKILQFTRLQCVTGRRKL